jgi:hypothetical protein
MALRAATYLNMWVGVWPLSVAACHLNPVAVVL